MHNYLSVVSITISKEVFLLFLLQISMTQKRLCYHLEYLCGTVINFLRILSSYCCTLLDYTSPSQYLVTLNYLLGHYVFVWFSYQMVHNSECYIFISGSSILSDCYGSPHKYASVTITTETYFHHQGIEFDFLHVWYISFKRSLALILFLVLDFDDWSLFLSSEYLIFWYSIFTLYIYSYNNWSLSIICCCFSGGMYVFLHVSVGFGFCANCFGSWKVLFETTFVIFSAFFFSTTCCFTDHQIPCCFYYFSYSLLWGSLKDISCQPFCGFSKLLYIPAARTFCKR